MGECIDVIVGRRVRRRRRLLGKTQRELGAECGVSFQQIQKYECANTRMSIVMLWKLARALDVDVGYFFSGVSPDSEVAEDHRPLGALPFEAVA